MSSGENTGIHAPAVIAFLQEREILRLYDAMNETSRRRLVLYAFYVEKWRGLDKKKRMDTHPPGDLDARDLRRILAGASPAETDRIYRHALALRDAEKKPEGD